MFVFIRYPGIKHNKLPCVSITTPFVFSIAILLSLSFYGGSAADMTQDEDDLLLEISYRLANLTANGDISGAINVLQSELAKEHSAGFKALLYSELGRQYEDIGDIPNAVENKKRAINLFSGKSSILMETQQVSRLLREVGKTDEATAFTAKVLTEKHLSKEIYIKLSGKLARDLYISGNKDESQKILNRLSTRYGSELDVAAEFAEVAYVCAARGEFEEFYTIMHQVATEFPCVWNDPIFLGNYAHSARTIDHIEESIELYEECVSRFPNHAQTPGRMLTVAMMCHENGNFAKALSYYQMILSLEDTGRESLAKIKERTKTNLELLEKRLGLKSDLKPIAEQTATEAFAISQKTTVHPSTEQIEMESIAAAQFKDTHKTKNIGASKAFIIALLLSTGAMGIGIAMWIKHANRQA